MARKSSGFVGRVVPCPTSASRRLSSRTMSFNGSLRGAPHRAVSRVCPLRGWMGARRLWRKREGTGPNRPRVDSYGLGAFQHNRTRMCLASAGPYMSNRGGRCRRGALGSCWPPERSADNVIIVSAANSSEAASWRSQRPARRTTGRESSLPQTAPFRAPPAPTSQRCNNKLTPGEDPSPLCIPQNCDAVKAGWPESLGFCGTGCGRRQHSCRPAF